MSHLFKQTNITATERSAFGETVAVEISPVFQIDGIYGIDNTDDWQINTGGSGSAETGTDLTFEVHSGVTPGSFCTLRSRRSVRYRPGQGSMTRFTAMFPDGPQLGYQQVAGFINQSDVLAVGYNVDGEFGIIRRYFSKAELWKLSVTFPCGAETISIELNGVTHEIITTTQSSTQETAALIATDLDWESLGWIVDYTGSDVFFLYNGPPGDLSGAFSFSSNGTATAIGETLIDGAAPADTWVYQSSFNEDTLDGNGPSKMILDKTKLNVYQIDFRWLGAGILRFAIEDQATGQMIPFHTIHYTNQNIQPSLSNPSMKVGFAVVNAAPGLGTGVDVHVKGASVMGAIQGAIVGNSSVFAVNSETTTNLDFGERHHLLTIKNKRIFGSTSADARLNQRELYLEAVSCGVRVTSGSRPVEVLLYKNANFVDGLSAPVPLVYEDVNKAIASSSTTARLDPSPSNPAQLVTAFTISPQTPSTIDLTQYRILLTPTDTISLVIYSPEQQVTDSLTSFIFVQE